MQRLLAVLLAVCLTTPAFAGPYLFELLQIKGYSKGFNTLLAHEKALPAWVTTFAKTMNGVASPSEDLNVAGADYVYATVCKPHDCGGNMLYVVFSFGGAPAYGLLQETGLDGRTKTRLLGQPDKAIEQALEAKAAQ